MPWRELSKVESRRMFISAVATGKWSIREVCRQFGVSRKTGYKWLNRWNTEGEEGLEDRSRRPKVIRYATDPEVEALLIADRKAHPSWGAPKLCRRLENNGIRPPPVRTANRILKRAGMIQKRKAKEEDLVRFERSHPNELWQIDHKRAIHGRWARRTVPFVVIDDCTRYCVGIRALPDKGLISTWNALWEFFGQFGLPGSILSDNDQIFHGTVGPSQFEARLMRLDINVLHGRPYHPQTQGKVERLNGTLECDLLRDGYFASCEELQSGFDRFRYEYNFERPHEALGMDFPGSRYRPSTRARPEKLPEMEYCSKALLRKVRKDGWISFDGHCFEVGRGLHGEQVEVREHDDGIEIYYGLYRLQGRRWDDTVRTTAYKLGRHRRNKR